MLSKPLAPQSVRAHRPGSWARACDCFWVPLSLHCEIMIKKKCWYWQKQWFNFFFLLWSGTLLLSSSHFLCEEKSLRHCFWHLILAWAEELWLLFSLCQNPQEPGWTQNTERHLVRELNWRRRGKKCFSHSPAAQTRLVCIRSKWKWNGMESYYDARGLFLLK